jgi:hypothetical protein
VSDHKLRPFSSLPVWHPGLLRSNLAEPTIFQFEINQYYLAGNPTRKIAVVMGPVSGQDRTGLVVTDNIKGVARWSVAGDSGLAELAMTLKVPLIDLAAPWKLKPVSIAKPWGQEIWYTGIEARGQSEVGDDKCSLPLPWLLGLMGEQVLGAGCEQPVLLKILDPLPQEVLGELYFELHQTKQEVYVVTAVDQVAWPDRSGRIRYGFDTALVDAYGDEDSFRQAFLALVNDYRAIRVEIDTMLDRLQQERGYNTEAPLGASERMALSSQIPQQLIRKEVIARNAMNRFIHEVPLAVGDVVKIEPLRPHALQHGVRAIEFQTPVYERKIISFPQKVVTQAHWDSAEAIAMMKLAPGAVESLAVVEECAGSILELVARFSDFVVYRLRLQPQGKWTLSLHGRHRVIIGLSGVVKVGALSLQPEEASLLPATLRQCRIVCGVDVQASCLICEPLPSGN